MLALSFVPSCWSAYVGYTNSHARKQTNAHLRRRQTIAVCRRFRWVEIRVVIRTGGEYLLQQQSQQQHYLLLLRARPSCFLMAILQYNSIPCAFCCYVPLDGFCIQIPRCHLVSVTLIWITDLVHAHSNSGGARNTHTQTVQVVREYLSCEVPRGGGMNHSSVEFPGV